MKYREKLGYIALGGFLMLVPMLAAGSILADWGRKAESDRFGKITCTAIGNGKSRTGERRRRQGAHRV